MATASSSQANSADKVAGPVRVVMPDQAGSFQVSANRAAVQHVQVVDVDMVLHMADGTKVVLAGGAMEAMDDKSKVKFNDISADTGKLLDTVGKISLKPNDQSRVLNSDPVVARPTWHRPSRSRWTATRPASAMKARPSSPRSSATIQPR
jgi:hypothetical protein